MKHYCADHSSKKSSEKVIAGCPAGEGHTQTGYAEKPRSVSPSERGKKGDLSIRLPPVSISIVKVRFAGSKLPCASGLQYLVTLANAQEAMSCVTFSWSLEVGGMKETGQQPLASGIRTIRPRKGSGGYGSN